MRCDLCSVLIDDSVSYVYVSYAGMNICTDCAEGVRYKLLIQGEKDGN